MHVELQTRTVECTGPLPEGKRIAIVGSRRIAPEIEEYTKRLAGDVVRAGGIVLSGGASGGDTAAHRGALDAGGRTWVIAPNGREHPYPTGNKRLFKYIERKPGCGMIWPFKPETHAQRSIFHERNRVLVELCDALVVVQANHGRSGAFSTATKALDARKPVWVVPPPPWIENAIGSILLVQRHPVRILWRSHSLLVATGLMKPDPIERRSDAHEQAVIDALENPLHREQLLGATKLGVSELSNVLFQLQMEGLIHERLDGRFERT